MVISFNPKFVKPIRGIPQPLKIHTIRQDKTNRWIPGRAMHMAPGVRTKNYKQFLYAECLGTQRITIDPDSLFTVHVNDKLLVYSELKTLALNDGFNSIDAFFAWFNQPFVGKIIHWTSFR